MFDHARELVQKLHAGAGRHITTNPSIFMSFFVRYYVVLVRFRHTHWHIVFTLTQILFRTKNMERYGS